jgi:hypothetical protein
MSRPKKEINQAWKCERRSEPHLYIDSPTPFGRMPIVQSLRWPLFVGGERFYYVGGLCTTFCPYKVGHPKIRFPDICGLGNLGCCVMWCGIHISLSVLSTSGLSQLRHVSVRMTKRSLMDSSTQSINRVMWCDPDQLAGASGRPSPPRGLTRNLLKAPGACRYHYRSPVACLANWRAPRSTPATLSHC